MNNKFKDKKCFLTNIKIKLAFISFSIYYFLLIISHDANLVNKNVTIAICTMGRMENLYVKEFIDYYLKMGIDHIFIYDNNEPNTEKISEITNQNYLQNVTIYETKKYRIFNQSAAFSQCYKNNLNQFDWFLMIDMDEFLYIIDDTLKDYLNNKRFKKCDFIKVHWVIPTDNDLMYYDPRPLLERFKPPYIKSPYIKSIIRGNISDLKYWVHSPYSSPTKKRTCNNVGKIVYNKNINFESIRPINIKKAYIIHFRYKSTEEFINKIKRGYQNWFKNDLEKFIINNIIYYLKINKATPEKINFIEKQLNLNLSKYITTFKS